MSRAAIVLGEAVAMRSDYALVRPQAGVVGAEIRQVSIGSPGPRIMRRERERAGDDRIEPDPAAGCIQRGKARRA